MGRSGALAVGRASEEERDNQRAKQMRRAKTKRRDKPRRKEGDDSGNDWGGGVRQMGDVKSPRL